MKNELKENYTNEKFEDIKHIDENGVEFWYARELQNVLDYKEWRKFENVINKAKQACGNSNISTFEHFVDADKLSKRANNAEVMIKDFIKEIKQEKAIIHLIRQQKKQGVKNFDKFHNAGYKGLYNGETADDIAKRKGLRYREDILDNMGSEELAANLFRITQTESRLKRDKIDTEKKANKTHYEVGKKVRKAIADIGGTMPEDLPTPKKSLKQLEKEKNKQLKDEN